MRIERELQILKYNVVLLVSLNLQIYNLLNYNYFTHTEVHKFADKILLTTMK